jgi:hypothetical protein
MALSTVQLEWWQNPFGIFTVVAIGLSVLLVALIVFVIVRLFIRHPKVCLIITGIIGIPIVLYNYLDDIILFFKGDLGQRIIAIAILAGVGLIALKIILAIRGKIILNRRLHNVLKRYHDDLDREQQEKLTQRRWDGTIK